MVFDPDGSGGKHAADLRKHGTLKAWLTPDREVMLATSAGAPTGLLVLGIDGEPQWILADAQYRLGTLEHLIVPVDAQAEEELRQFVSLTDGFTGTNRQAVLTSLRQPGFYWQVRQLERQLERLVTTKTGEPPAPAQKEPRAPESRLMDWLQRKALLYSFVGLVVVAAGAAIYFTTREGAPTLPPYGTPIVERLTKLREQARNLPGPEGQFLRTWLNENYVDDPPNGVNPKIPELFVRLAAYPNPGKVTGAQALMVGAPQIRELVLDAACRVDPPRPFVAMTPPDTGGMQVALILDQKCPETTLSEGDVHFKLSALETTLRAAAEKVRADQDKKDAEPSTEDPTPKPPDNTTKTPSNRQRGRSDKTKMVDPVGRGQGSTGE